MVPPDRGADSPRGWRTRWALEVQAARRAGGQPTIVSLTSLPRGRSGQDSASCVVGRKWPSPLQVTKTRRHRPRQERKPGAREAASRSPATAGSGDAGHVFRLPVRGSALACLFSPRGTGGPSRLCTPRPHFLSSWEKGPYPRHSRIRDGVGVFPALILVIPEPAPCLEDLGATAPWASRSPSHGSEVGKRWLSVPTAALGSEEGGVGGGDAEPKGPTTGGGWSIACRAEPLWLGSGQGWACRWPVATNGSSLLDWAGCVKSWCGRS